MGNLMNIPDGYYIVEVKNNIVNNPKNWVETNNWTPSGNCGNCKHRLDCDGIHYRIYDKSKRGHYHRTIIGDANDSCTRWESKV